jgi:hypothetical protein
MLDRYLKAVFCVCLVFQSTVCWSTENMAGAWLGTFGKKSLTETSSFWSEVQLRYNADNGTMGQTLFRGGWLEKVSENHEFGLLFGYIQTNLQKEYRPTLQHIYQSKIFSETNLSLRSRLELRDLENNSDTSVRYRLMMRAQSPINSYLSFVLWDEPFINITDENWTGSRVFERNRFFAGFRFPYESLTIETGYLNQFVPREVEVSEHLFVVYVNY